jgi:hypothetical protein
MGWLISAAGRLLSYWRWIAAGAVLVAVAAGAVWVRGVVAERDELRREVASLEQAVAARDATIAQQRQAMAVADADRARAEAAYRNLQAARERVLRAPETDDAPQAPVMLDALRSLRERAASAAP